MDASSQLSTRLARGAVSLPHTPHSAIICGQTGCGKTVFCLELLEGPYRGVFRHIVILCPTIRHNVTYQGRPWVWGDPEVYIIDPGERMHDWLRFWYRRFQGMTKKRDTLSKLAFSSRHAQQSVCDTIRSSKTCGRRPSGWPYSTVKIETPSKNASGRTML